MRVSSRDRRLVFGVLGRSLIDGGRRPAHPFDALVQRRLVVLDLGDQQGAGRGGLQELLFSSSRNVDSAIARMKAEGAIFLTYKSLCYELVEAVEGNRHTERILKTFGPRPDDLPDSAFNDPSTKIKGKLDGLVACAGSSCVHGRLQARMERGDDGADRQDLRHRGGLAARGALGRTTTSVSRACIRRWRSPYMVAGNGGHAVARLKRSRDSGGRPTKAADSARTDGGVIPK
jgi:hypothetical protein